jgi:hypothetical protein
MTGFCPWAKFGSQGGRNPFLRNNGPPDAGKCRPQFQTNRRLPAGAAMTYKFYEAFIVRHFNFSFKS